ncbi:MAG: GNAT family N-acetyltransferase, partial [Verrucomicrobium sp.]
WSPADHLQFVPAGVDDLTVVNALAHEIWPQVYHELISAEQIQYMLGQMYALAKLQDDVTERQVQYRLIREANGHDAGFYAWEKTPGEPAVSLHKLYVRPALHGKGIGAAALRHILQEAAATGASALKLRVNRQNRKAIRAYLRAGFEFEEDLCTDIGGGFVMDDHVMVKRL